MQSPSPRERLLDAADALMHLRGYEAVGVAEICEAAAVKKGSFYHFFDSKRALALEMLNRAWNRTRDELFIAVFADPSLSTLDAIDRYSSVLATHLAATLEADDVVAGCRFGNLAAELATHDPAIRDAIGDIFAEMTDIVAQSLARGIDSGELRADLEPRAAAEEFIALMEGRMILAKTTLDPAHLKKLAATARLLYSADDAAHDTRPARAR